MRALRLAIVALSAVLAIAASAFAWLARDTPAPAAQSLGSKAIDIAFPIAALTFVAVAELILRRRPRHVVGWMFLVLGLAAEVLLFCEGYGLYATLTAPGALPGGGTVMWLTTWIWSPPTAALVVALLVFPDGRPISPRWWIVAWVAVGGAVLQGVADAYRTPLELGVVMDSPLGTPFPTAALDLCSAIGTFAWAAAALAAGASLIVRFRLASGLERQQLKWVAYGSAIASLGLVFATFAYAIPEIGPFGAGVASLGVLLIPISFALAILRYRLYDIDVVIERTLVYAGLTATLVATYWILVLLLQSLFRPLTAGSEVAVAASTLATLALVQPLYARIRRAVDRRFYRARYDAERAVDRFVTELSGEVELGAVRASLLAAVGETLQPSQASVWLRIPAGRPPSGGRNALGTPAD